MDDRQAAGETHFQRAEACLPHLLGRVTLAPAAPRRIDGGLPTEGAIAHRLVSRFANHLAFYRQSQFLARCGMQIDRSTRADWSGQRRLPPQPAVALLPNGFWWLPMQKGATAQPGIYAGRWRDQTQTCGCTRHGPKGGPQALGAFGPLLLPP